MNSAPGQCARKIAVRTKNFGQKFSDKIRVVFRPTHGQLEVLLGHVLVCGLPLQKDAQLKVSPDNTTN
jgi:hypothetical protein